MPKNNKINDEHNVEFRLSGSSRKELRDKTINKFLEEHSGYWKDGVKHVTKYKYFVETLKDGRRIYLLRPTFLNKGIDFQVWVEHMNGEEDKRPSHKNVIEDLKLKKLESSSKIKLLMSLINEVWNCKEPDTCLKENPLSFKGGFSVELLLKILKWLFIEQDITYWNYDGRTMLKQGLDKELATE